ncbi:MAG: hypothetical protein Q8M03_07865 [Legionella sp.]|nr:hypothetical protein [Legionella sp.]
MPLASRYYPSDVRNVLKVAKLTPSGFRELYGYNDPEPGFYQNEHAIVLDAATDTVSVNQKLQTITQAFDAIAKLPENEKSKQIIIPVTEEQKILGLFKRNHWVTLSYDPQKNVATLLDSRPWIVSFLYPTSAMKKSLTEGIRKVFPANADTLKFQTRYQGVQYNDTHCGAWVTTNIRDLAGANKEGVLKTINQQVGAYSRDDEAKIVEYNVQSVAQKTLDVEIIIVKPSWFQRLLNFLGITKPMPPESRFVPVSDEVAEPYKGGSFAVMRDGFESGNLGSSLVDDFEMDASDDFEVIDKSPDLSSPQSEEPESPSISP